MRPPAPRRANGLLLAGVGRAENRRNLRKDLAEAGRHARHNCAGRDRNKTRHQSVLDEVLAALIFPNLELQKQILHFVSLSPLPMVRDSTLPQLKSIIGRFLKESVLTLMPGLKSPQNNDFQRTWKYCRTMTLHAILPAPAHQSIDSSRCYSLNQGKA